MSEALKPCPFCGSVAEIIHITGGENEGGSCVSCTQCQASSNVEFEFKENFVSNWNRRAEGAVTMTDQRAELANLIIGRLLGVKPDDPDLVLEDPDWRVIIEALQAADQA